MLEVNTGSWGQMETQIPALKRNTTSSVISHISYTPPTVP